jgi:hypothetical protein
MGYKEGRIAIGALIHSFSKEISLYARQLVVLIISVSIKLNAVRHAVSRISYQQFTNVFFDVSVINLGQLNHYMSASEILYIVGQYDELQSTRNLRDTLLAYSP